MKSVKRIHVKTGSEDRTLNTVFSILLLCFAVIILYPLIFVVSSSFSSGAAVTGGKVVLLPVEFSLLGYQIVFENKNVWIGYGNTIFYTVVSTVFSLILTVLAAYPLSRKNFFGRGIYMTLFMIPMFFTGGLIPNYILMTNLKLVNTRWAIILSGSLSVYNLVIMRTFFQNSVPGELLDASKIDGVTDAGYLVRILLPLSKAVLAVITLYYGVAQWNSYFNALIYLRDRKLQPLQLMLKDILSAASLDVSQIESGEQFAKMVGAADVMKYSLIVVSTVPILIAYPFVQKFFQKGVMIGSVKG